MPTGVVVLVYVEEYVKGDMLLSLGSELIKEFDLSEEDFPCGGPLVYLPREDYDLAHKEGEPGFLLDLNLSRSYYGVGYERGDLPLFIGIAEWLERELPGCEVLYGHDGTGEGFPFGFGERAKLMAYHDKVGGEPYYRKDLTWEEKAQFWKLYDT